LKEKLIGSDREGLGLEIGLGLGDLNQITDLNLTPCYNQRLTQRTADPLTVYVSVRRLRFTAG